MREQILTVSDNVPLTSAIFRMTLQGENLEPQRPGQFISLSLPGRFLRRPISVFNQGKNWLQIIYKVVGEGTREMAGLPAGTALNVLTGLGNGYDLTRAGERPLLLGGGVGVPPLYLLAKELRAENREITVVTGFNSAEETFGRGAFEELGCRVTVTTADGSEGVRGFVTDALPDHYSYVYACGPEPMLRAVSRKIQTGGQFSLEERMGCGFGACMGCTCQTKNGPKRICREGPVLEKEEILWND